MKFGISLSLMIFCLFSCTKTTEYSVNAKANNTIFFIGDGMGISMLTSTRIYAKGSQGKMNFENFSHTGFAKTYSTDDFTTDSAAGATALASGVKTYNGAIGLSDPNFDPKSQSRVLETILDVAHKAGKSIGIITTTRVTHATPASFYSHAKHRHMEELIAKQVANSKLTFLLGGGRKYFFNSKKKVDIISDLKNKGWTYVDNAQDLNTIDTNQEKLKVLGLFHESHLTYSFDRKTLSGIERIEPTLSQMVFWGIRTLAKNPKGYILIVEAGRIDHAAHENHFRRMAEETIELDEAFKMAMNKSDPSTLIVSTADHETGGLSISGYADMKTTKGDLLVAKRKGEIRTHITWATGPEAKKYAERNTDYNKRLKKQSPTKKEKGEPALYFKEYANHTAVDVPVMSIGPGASLFTGFMNNTQIPRKILQAMGLEFSNLANEENKDH